MTVGRRRSTRCAHRDRRDDGLPRGAARDAEVSAVTYDSRRVVPGAVFVALRGLKADGADVRRAGRSRAARSLIVAESRRGPRAVRRHGSSSAMRGWRSRCSPTRSTTIPAAACTSSASPAPTARPRRRICSPSILDAAGLQGGPARHRDLPPRRRRARSVAHDARSARRAAAARRDDPPGLQSRA